jgi:hypothetical protein
VAVRSAKRSPTVFAHERMASRAWSGEIDDERVIDAWVRTALAFARHYGIDGA